VTAAPPPSVNECLIEAPVGGSAIETSKRSELRERFLDRTTARETDFKT
jgi:hypothetical protein